MKTALIEYHRERLAEALTCSALTSGHQTQELAAYKAKIEFHDLAVKWLESLPDDKPMTPGHLRFLKEKSGTI